MRAPLTVTVRLMPITPTELKRDAYRSVIDGKPVDLYTLRNARGWAARLTNHGARLVQLLVPDRDGIFADVVLGYDSIGQTIGGQPSAGATIGRFAGRIRNAAFELDGKTWHLTANDGPHHLHGGTRGSRCVVFGADQTAFNEVRFSYTFADGEEGYPGNCRLDVTYSLTDDGALQIATTATTDKPTVVNFTNHAFWNLGGGGDVLGHTLTILAERFAPHDAAMIPTGEVLDVAGTPFDFRHGDSIGRRIDCEHPQLRYGGGYGTNYLLGAPVPKPRHVATVHEPLSGRVMRVDTTESSLLFFSGNNFNGQAPRDIGKGGMPYGRHAGFALEAQHLPDSPNLPAFPSTRLDPGQRLASLTIHRFSTLP